MDNDNILGFFSMLDANDESEYFLENMNWQDFAELFFQLKILEIVSLRLNQNTGSESLHSIDQEDFLRKMVELSDDTDYESLITGLEELRWRMWHRDCGTEIEVTAVAIEFEDREEDEAWKEEIQAAFEEELDGKIASADRDIIVKKLAGVSQDIYDIEEYHISVWTFPWIHKALQKKEKFAAILKKELSEISSGFYYNGSDFYCIEVVATAETMYLHYPTAFTPFKLSILEKMAKEVCAEKRSKKEGEVFNEK